jgi:hypothetical protein
MRRVGTFGTTWQDWFVGNRCHGVCGRHVWTEGLMCRQTGIIQDKGIRWYRRINCEEMFKETRKNQMRDITTDGCHQLANINTEVLTGYHRSETFFSWPLKTPILYILLKLAYLLQDCTNLLHLLNIAHWEQDCTNLLHLLKVALWEQDCTNLVHLLKENFIKQNWNLHTSTRLY